ncbi:MAG: exodeoxyribonuclease VII large subunit, partial [Xanthomonadales bacterium]|nr:exodeoxyribonuclease VII large subunit [Xanthomonadales bacterium]
GRRFPLVDVEILPVPVQGKEAPAAIVAMLDAASRARRHDVLLLTRGGGSLEDLWAFNDESLARAIARCSIPLVSAVGHEIDFSISDFVADLRAPTPSAAAELLVPDIGELDRELRQKHERLRLRMLRRIENASQRSDHLLARLNLQRPAARLLRGRERLQQLSARLGRIAERTLERRRSRLAHARTGLSIHDPGRRLQAAGERASAFQARLLGETRHLLERRRSHVEELARALHAFSPLATLARGYAVLVESRSGQVVRRTGQVAPGDRLRAILADGELPLRVDTED